MQFSPIASDFALAWRRRFQPVRALAVAGLLALTAGSLPAATMTDTFADGDRTNGPSAADLQFFAFNGDSGGGASLSLAPAFDGNALQVDTLLTFRGVVGSSKSGGGVALTNVNDFLTLSFQLQLVNMAAGDLRIGFFNSNGTGVVADNTASSNDDFGYRSLISAGGAAAPANIGVLFQETGSTLPVGAGEVSSSTITSNATTATYAALGTTVHTVDFTITRTSASALSFSFGLDGQVLRTGSDTGAVTNTQGGAGVYDTFDEFAINATTATAGIDYRIDNVSISSNLNIPEPGSGLLLGLGAVMMAGRRRVR